jgi:hypothetical protein
MEEIVKRGALKFVIFTKYYESDQIKKHEWKGNVAHTG